MRNASAVPAGAPRRAGTAVDGLAATLRHGRGVLVAPGDPPALAAAISHILAGQRPARPGPGRAGPRLC
jgi:hypothetical protein